MEHKVKIISPEEGMEQLLGLLNEMKDVPLRISGDSMTPFLVHQRDVVYLSRITEPLKKGDMVLYQRRSGAYVLHRILKVDRDSYTMLGDAQTLPEPGIRLSQMRGLVTAVRRKDKLLRKGSFWWDFFEKVWIRLVPLRPGLRNAYFTLKRLCGKRGAL